MKKWKIKGGYGIQRRYLAYTISLLLLALLLSSIGVWLYVKNNMVTVVTEKYEFMNEKMGLALDSMYQNSDVVTADCILYDGIQKSLRMRPLEDVEKTALSKYFAYADLENISEYLYVDNKQNIYARSYTRVDYEDFMNSGFADLLGSDYARTKWIWAEDTLFGTGEPALFIARYARALDYAHEPGILIFKMDDSYLANLMQTEQEKTSEAAIGIIDTDGNLLKSWLPSDYQIPDGDMETIRMLAAERRDAGMIVAGQDLQSGVLAAYRQENTGLTVFTVVPDSVVWNYLGNIILVLFSIYLVVIVIAVNLSIYLSKRFTRPIKKISEAMTQFDGNDFTKTIKLHTNTELDKIGDSYNEMVKNIEQLLAEIKAQEKELRTSELNMLFSQINPHFLYNTLDTIYMLARINKEETTMKMIQALSKYLRISLSKGSDMVTIADELENVKSYMEIQQIRNENLFRFEIDAEVDLNKRVLKLILQPLVENSIKYGFSKIFEGGIIRISVFETDGFLVFQVYNNGEPMEEAVIEKINAMNGRAVSEVNSLFPDRAQGYGVMNIMTRIRLKYGNSVQFYYEASESGTNCIVKIPESEQNDEKI